MSGMRSSALSRRRAALLAPFLLLLASLCAADDRVITADLVERKVDPVNPTLNIQGIDSVLVDMKGELEGVADKDIFSTLDLPRYKKVAGSNQGVELLRETKETKGLVTRGRQVAITFRSCRKEDFKAEGVTPPPGQPCGFALLRDDLKASWVVFANAQPVTFTIRVNDEFNEAKYQYSFVIRIEDKAWALAWSAGISILGVKDHRYRLRSRDGDDQLADLVRVSDGSYPYQLAAFANYMSLRHSWFGFSAGLATEVPSEQLTAMAGVSFALRTLPISNTAYVTLGGSYTQRARLRAEFEGRDTVPVDVTADALVEQRYGFGAFLGISFGFLGGQEQFTGVFKGKDEGE
jgi:hypothetical protein